MIRIVKTHRLLGTAIATRISAIAATAGAAHAQTTQSTPPASVTAAQDRIICTSQPGSPLSARASRLKRDLFRNVKYNAMVATNLSILDVSAAQLDNNIDTQSVALTWLPTTGEFGLYGTFGDYDWHQKLATRLGVHWSHSLEDTQSQPGANAIENTQIRLSDGSIIFTPNLFGLGIVVETVDYKMSSIDAGAKCHGMSVEGEFYWRWLGHYTGHNVERIPRIRDTGYQLQTSVMAIKDVLQLYVSGSQIFGDFGHPSEIRLGESWYFMKQRGLRLNGEFIHVNHSPVGYTAYPMPVGASGPIFHINLEMNF